MKNTWFGCQNVTGMIVLDFCQLYMACKRKIPDDSLPVIWKMKLWRSLLCVDLRRTWEEAKFDGKAVFPLESVLLHSQRPEQPVGGRHPIIKIHAT